MASNTSSCKSQINAFYSNLHQNITNNTLLHTAYQSAIGECSSTGDVAKAIGYIGIAALKVAGSNTDATNTINTLWVNANVGYSVPSNDVTTFSTPTASHTPVASTTSIPTSGADTTTTVGGKPNVDTSNAETGTSATPSNNNWIKWTVGIVVVLAIGIWAWKKYGSNQA